MTRPLIIIADDNRDTREMYALYLSMVGYKVEEAADGREALIKARTLGPDLIVMDLQMPEVDGWAAIRELRGDIKTHEIPILVLTGHDFKDFLKPAALAVGARSFLKKPCLPERLAREIGERIAAPDRRVARSF
jgi:CheY-like chemotaxis protein